MKKTVVVVTDLGSFKAFRLYQTPEKKTPRLELLEEFTSLEAHAKLVDKVTDHAGRYRVPNTRMAMSYGENHKIALEVRKRLVRQLGRRLNALLRRPEVEECHFAASKEISHQVLDALDPRVRAKITKHVPHDLTKVDKAELLAHF
jgi:hypothetical protein